MAIVKRVDKSTHFDKNYGASVVTGLFWKCSKIMICGQSVGNIYLELN